MPLNTTALKRTVGLGNIFNSGGTWTRVTNAGLPYFSKSAAANTTALNIPIDPISLDGQFGANLTTIEIPIRVATQNLVSAPTVALYRRSMIAATGAGTNMTASTITCTLTGNTATLAATDRLLKVTVTSPGLDYSTVNKPSYSLVLTFNAGTSSAIRVYEPIAYFQVPV